MSYGLGFSFEVWVCRSVWYFHCRSTAGPGSINTFLVFLGEYRFPGVRKHISTLQLVSCFSYESWNKRQETYQNCCPGPLCTFVQTGDFAGSSLAEGCCINVFSNRNSHLGCLSWLRPLWIPITSLYFWLGMQRDATLVRSLLLRPLCTDIVLMPRESIYSDLHIWFPDIVMSQLYGKAWYHPEAAV